MPDEPTELSPRSANRPSGSAVFATGTTIGHYRIDGVLGSGGMGVVYRATDTKLGRSVAMKFLAPAVVVAGTEAQLRFRQEAETASALNHPHIVTVHDVGVHEGSPYIVTELVDGGTLESWSASARAPWRKVVELMIGVADALAVAHAAHILHRDIKPANILIDKAGYAKLTDFGIAKLMQDPGAGSSSSSARTGTGLVVGTAAYMSPEQALGRPLDTRSDVFAFGVVLYELLAGQHPFTGESGAVLLQSVIHDAPRPLPEQLPEQLKMIVEKALEKDPEDRYQSMRDLVVDLRRLSRNSSGQLAAARFSPRPSPARLPWSVAALGLVALAGVTAFSLLRSPPQLPGRPVEFTIPPPENTAFSTGLPANQSVAISPDGTQLAFAAVGTDGITRLWVRALSSAKPRLLAETDRASEPAWSPDGRSLAFFANGKLLRIDLAGGSVQTLADGCSQPLGASWSRDGMIIYAPAPGSPVLGIPATGGTPKPVTRFGAPALAHIKPTFLADGQHFIYGQLSATGSDIMVGALDAGDGKLLMTGTRVATYAPGFILFVRGGALFAKPFDDTRLELSDGEFPLAPDVSNVFAASSNGTLAYLPAVSLVSDLNWAERNGRPLGVAAPPSTYEYIALSPDGTRVAFNREAPSGRDVWILDLNSRVETRLTFTQSGISEIPLWSPDGTQVAYSSLRSDGFDLYRRASNFSGSEEAMSALHMNSVVWASDWSRDGKYMTFAQTTAAGSMDQWIVPIEGGEPFALLAEPFNENQAQFSPDGKWIAYVSDETGTSQIYVQSFPKLGGKRQISNAGGTQPRWAQNATELYYLGLDGKLMAVAVTTGDVFEARSTETLFATTLDVGALRQTYAVAPDGRFLLNAPVTTSPPLSVVLNWPESLSR